MLEIAIPGAASLRLEHLVLDYNGTIARDGELLPGVAGRVHALSGHLHVHVVTADTFGTAADHTAGMPCRLTVLPARAQAEAKRDYVRRLGADAVACIGNGRNDRLMLEAAALGIVVVQSEGAAASAVAVADVLAPSIDDALDLLLFPQRLVATLRA